MAVEVDGDASIVSSMFRRHDVFLSFRGEDTRKTFVSHLYNALCQKKIETYKDDVKLQIGDEIPVGLFKAIEESKIAVVVFSKTYAFSSWCLSELSRIVQCNIKNSRYCILPVFYDVDPSHVRNQEGSYGDAFVQVHEKCSKRTAAEVMAWKNALKSSANLTGWDSRFMRSDSELIDQIVKAVLRKLNRLSPVSDDDLNNLVGIHNQISAIKQILRDGSSEERIIGIWGTGGIGKTTLASVVFNRFSTEFESSYFLPNVSEELKNHGFTTLQARLFAGLLEEDSVNVGTPSLVSSSGEERLRNTKVLVVLDDVTSSDQFDKILLRRFIQRFGDRSIIIVTTRDLQVLTSIKACEKYKVEELNGPSALKLFCSHAFDKGSDTTEYTQLLNRVVNHAKGIPLALKVFGSYLYSKSKREWEDELDKLIPNQELQDLFERSYCGLDYESREIFLDVVAFFKGEDRCFVESVLDGCKLSANRGIRKLIHKSLITIRRHKQLWMHNLVQQAGQEIIHKKWEELGKHCRLWKAEDICEVLATDTEREAVKGIFLDVTKIKERLYLSSSAFSKMRNLRFLKIYKSGNVKQKKLYLSQEGLESLPKSLVYFHWHGYPLNCLPSNFTPENLVELGLPYSKVEKLWNEDKNLGNLKRIDLSYSKNLTQVPDLSSASNVESINLEHCIRLLQVPLHQNLHKLTSLNLHGCSSLQNLSELPRNIMCLNIKNCSRLQSIPAEICELKSLCSLNLSGCSALKDFPEISRPMECLIELILDRTAIENLPSSINLLIALKTLSMDMCRNLEALPDSISALDTLQSLSIRCCPKLLHLPALPPSLPSVDARDCTSLQTVSSSKAVTEGWNCDNINGATFIFYNCANLDRNARNNIMVDAQHRIMHIANVTSKDVRDPNMIEICWPGNEIPKWFKSQLEESSINVTVPPTQFDDKFIGFVFCIVVDFKDCNLDGDFKIYCESHCAFPDGFETTWRHTWIWHWNDRDKSQTMENGLAESTSKSVNSPHLFLFYHNGRHIHSNLYARKDTNSSSSAYDKNVSVTFEFHPIDSNRQVNCSNFQVKSCGIRLLYAHDITNSGFLSQDDEESTKEDGEILIMEEDAELMVQEDEEIEHLFENEIDLQMNGLHLEENDERKLTSCCLGLHSQMLEFCGRFSSKRSTGLHNGLGYKPHVEASRLRVISSQSMVVQEWPPLKYEQVIQLLMEVQDQNKQILQYLQLMKTTNPSSRLIPEGVPQASN